MTRKTGIIALALVALAGAVALAWTVRKSTEIHANPPVQGAMRDFTVSRDRPPAPAARLIAADGKALTLADFKGRIVVVNFWATWCAPCIKEMPSLDRLRAKLPEERVMVMALSQDLKGWPVIQPFLDTNGLKSLPIYFDPDGEVARGTGVAVLPTTVIFGRDGRMQGSFVGAAEWDSDDAVKLIRYYADKGAK